MACYCPAPPDEAADAEREALRTRVGETGVHFLGIDNAHIYFNVHGDPHPPVHVRELGEMLGEIRQARRS